MPRIGIPQRRQFIVLLGVLFALGILIASVIWVLRTNEPEAIISLLSSLSAVQAHLSKAVK